MNWIDWMIVAVLALGMTVWTVRFSGRVKGVAGFLAGHRAGGDMLEHRLRGSLGGFILSPQARDQNQQ